MCEIIASPATNAKNAGIFLMNLLIINKGMQSIIYRTNIIN
jgi:hypothetical protein